jgi:quercetin dioxygenase-like cupin family protein
MKITVRDHVKLQPEKMAKIALATTPRAQLDLYCLAAGQTQKTHVHADQDKICYVVEGRGRFTAGGADETLQAGEAIVAAAGTAHGISNTGDGPLVVLVVVTPPPAHA